MAIVLCSFVPASAFAQAPEAEAESDVTDEAAARELFRTGSLHFDAGDYAEAADDFEASYELSGRPELLYNIYLSNERLGRLERAIAALEGFLDRGDVGERREPLQRRLSNLRERRSEELANESAAREREQELRDAAAERGDPGALPWVIAGAGAAFVAGGVILLVVAQADIEAVENPSDPMPRWADAESAYDRAPILSTVGAIALGVGGAALVGGLTWGLLVATRGEPEVDVGVGPGFVSVRGRF